MMNGNIFKIEKCVGGAGMLNMATQEKDKMLKMTREEMVKRQWKPYMVIDYQDEGMKMSAECLLSAIDFDAEVLTLTPINEFYNQKEFVANLKFCSIPKKLKAATIGGKKIQPFETNFIKAKMDIPDEESDFDNAS